MRIWLLTLFLAFFFTLNSCAQELQDGKPHSSIAIGFYNIENLFDTIDQEGVLDEEFTPSGAKSWNTEKYHKKLENLAEVISQLGTEINPDGAAVLGIAEVENRSTLEDLVNIDKLKSHNYQIVHYDGPDHRAVDVALLYNPKYFKVQSSHSFTLTLPDDTAFATRDQLLVSGRLDGESAHVMVAHWPSRRGGQKASEPKRIAAAQLGRAVVDSLLKSDPQAKVIYMGDLNDDPDNNSLTNHLLVTSSDADTIGKKLFNPMWELHEQGKGTLAWRSRWNLFDQILLSRALVSGDTSSWQYHSVKIFDAAFLKQGTGKYKGEPLRGYAGNTWLGGYSDHFPVYIVMTRDLSR